MRFDKTIIGVAIGMTLMMGTISSASAKGQDSEPFKIGYIDPFVGQALFFSDDNRITAKNMVDQINKRGGLNGRKIELIIRDDKLKPAEARRLAEDLITRDKVDVLTGTTAASEALAVAEVAKAHKTIFFAQFALTSTLTEDQWSPYIFQPHMSTRVWCGAQAKFGLEQGFKRWAIINPDYEFGRSCGGDFEKELKKLSPDVEIVSVQWPKFGAPDMTAEIGAVMAKEPEAIYTSVWGAQIVTLIKQMNAAGAFEKTKLFGSIPTPVAVTLGKEFPSNSVYGMTPLPFGYEPFNAFINDYHQMNNRWPGDGAVFSMMPYLFLEAAANKAKSTDTNDLITALENLTVDTPVGPVTVREWDHSGNLGTCGGWFVPSEEFEFFYMSDPRCVSGDEMLLNEEQWMKTYGENRAKAMIKFNK